MPKFDRQSLQDAEKACKLFIPDDDARLATLKFLADSISYTNNLSPENWCVNLDKNGSFIRLNVGSVYCVNIHRKYSNILCLRESVKQAFNIMPSDIKFIGYQGKNMQVKDDIDKTPNCLESVNGSIGCHIPHNKATEYLPIIKKANQDFIDNAISTVSRANIFQAHSPNILEYLDNLGLFV